METINLKLSNTAATADAAADEGKRTHIPFSSFLIDFDIQIDFQSFLYAVDLMEEDDTLALPPPPQGQKKRKNKT